MVDQITKETRKGEGDPNDDIGILVRKLLKNATPLSDDGFWGICDKLAHEFICGRRGEVAIQSFVDKQVAVWDLHSFYQTAAFAMDYCRKKNSLEQLLRDVDTRRGDDSYGDLIDALPLLGRFAVESMWDADTSFDAFESRYTGTPLGNTVFNGENYIEMRLVDSLVARIPDMDCFRKQ